MTIDATTIIASFASVLGIVLGYFLSDLRDKHKETKAVQDRHTKEITDIKILVAGNYVTKDDLKEIVQVLFEKLDGIEVCVDGVKKELSKEINDIKLDCAKAGHGR